MKEETVMILVIGLLAIIGLILGINNMQNIKDYHSLALKYNSLAANYTKLTDDYNILNTNLAQFEMYYSDKYGEIFNNKSITGVAYPDKGFFCAYAKGRTYSAIMETCNHEYLHIKYADDWEHFMRDEG